MDDLNDVFRNAKCLRMTFDEWLRSYPWLNDHGRQCIVSADLDGVACSLLQSLKCHWKTVGIYDGKFLALYSEIETIDWEQVIFVDVEILRPHIHSIGNHLFALDNTHVDCLRSVFPKCMNPNLWRRINVNDSFQRKYPFSTLPLFLAAHALHDDAFELDRFWMGLALHTDSSFTNAAHYQANALDWLAAMDTNGASPGLDRMCRLLKRVPGQSMLALLNEVQTWIGAAGFGAKQRACRFDPRVDSDNDRIAALVNRLFTELDQRANLPFGQMPVYREEFRTEVLPNDAKTRRRRSFEHAFAQRVISMAATARSDKGLSVTVPNSDTPIICLR